jgi:hypothetical protein
MTADGSGDPFAVDGERALDALTLAWADEYDGDISHEGHLGNDSTDGSEHDAPLSRQDLRRA